MKRKEYRSEEMEGKGAERECQGERKSEGDEGER